MHRRSPSHEGGQTAGPSTAPARHERKSEGWALVNPIVGGMKIDLKSEAAIDIFHPRDASSMDSNQLTMAQSVKIAVGGWALIALYFWGAPILETGGIEVRLLAGVIALCLVAAAVITMRRSGLLDHVSPVMSTPSFLLEPITPVPPPAPLLNAPNEVVSYYASRLSPMRMEPLMPGSNEAFVSAHGLALERSSSDLTLSMSHASTMSLTSARGSIEDLSGSREGLLKASASADSLLNMPRSSSNDSNTGLKRRITPVATLHSSIPSTPEGATATVTARDVSLAPVPEAGAGVGLDAATTAAPREIGEIKMLLVEDNPVNTEVARKLLKIIGHVPETAVNGLEALVYVERYLASVETGAVAFQPMIILMDLHMPVLDGRQATERIRAAYKQAGLPQPYIAAVTADVYDSTREECLSTHFNDFLAKPLYLRVLKERLAAAKKVLMTR